MMKLLRDVLLLGIAASSLVAGAARASTEDMLPGDIQPSSEQIMGQGRSALWTLPHVATQYQPAQPTPVMQASLQAQQQGRFLEALILLDDALKSGQADANTNAGMNLLRSSFLLQGYQSRQVIETLAPLLGKTPYAADAYALTAMARLQLGQMQQALEEAQRAHGLVKDTEKDMRDGLLPHLALSYALQGMGRLAGARETMRGFNTQVANTGASNAGTPQHAIALAREAELALTLDQVYSARTLVDRALEADAANAYVIAVSGLAYLIDGHAQQAKAAFETALQRASKDAKALLGLGLAEIKLGNFPSGLQKLQEAHEAEPGNALILTYLGRAQQQAGQTEAATASWRSAQQADPKDPTPWLYQAQAALRANRPLDARESLREAQARAAYRQVYRGERLLGEDQQLLQANLAETQRRMGLENLAFHTLTDSFGEKNANLRNQADLLQGQRFGESARRSLLLQSLFNERPGNLPAALDIYGDGAGQTGASTPQHGAVSGLSAQHASYNDYDELFARRTTLEADVTTGSKNTSGEQIRLGVGSDTLGLGLAGLQFKSDGFAPFENLDNRVAQATVQWRPNQTTQAFVAYQTFDSQRGEVFSPADPLFGNNAAIEDNSKVTRLGLRHNLADDSELRGLWSSQKTDQAVEYYDLSAPPNFLFLVNGSSSAHSAELQYRRSGTRYATQWGVQHTRVQIDYSYPEFSYGYGYTKRAQHLYAAWQQALNQNWQLETGLGLGNVESQYADASSNTSLEHWLPMLGLAYTPDNGTHVRLAAWRGMGVFATGDAALAPVSLAGVLLARAGDSGKLVDAVALGGDRQLNPAWLLAAETQRRKSGEPAIDGFTGQQNLLEQQVDESRLALHWQPQEKPWIASLAYADERIQNDPRLIALDSVDEQHLRSQQLALRWLADARWTANLAWSHNQVTGTNKFTDPILYTPALAAYQDGFNQLDTDLNWQFNGTGSLTAGVRNAADTRFQYTEIDPLNPRFSNGRLVYAKLKFAW